MLSTIYTIALSLQLLNIMKSIAMNPWPLCRNKYRRPFVNNNCRWKATYATIVIASSSSGDGSRYSNSHSIKSIRDGRSQSFYESIGSPKFISAPMVEHSSLAWRLLSRKHGCDLAYTQMMHAKNFITHSSYRADCIDWGHYIRNDDQQPDDSISSLDLPIIAQFAGDCPQTLVEAGKYIQDGVSAIDLNLGCPQKIAKKGHYGSFLLPNKELVCKILSTMVKELRVPITAKIRRLPSEEDTITLCRMIEDTGVQLLTVHGRTAESNKHFIGPADWDIIRKIKQSISIPVIANGGIQCYDDVVRCLEYTGADGVMSSEGLLEHPALFSKEEDQQFHEHYISHQLTIAQELVDLFVLYGREHHHFQMRGHLFKILYRITDAEKNKDFRKRLSEGPISGIPALLHDIHGRYAAIGYDDVTALSMGMLTEDRWYMRHRTEKASTRVMSPPKFIIRAAEKLKTLSGNTLTEDNLKSKIANLKERLLEKQKLLQE